MDNIQTLESIRLLANGDEPSYDISDFLLKYKCLYLLSRFKIVNQATDLCKAMVATNALVIKERFQTCDQLFRDLTSIDYAVIKGAVLSKSEYGKYGYRHSSDIDLLITRENVNHVKDLLFGNGFIQGRIENDKIVPFSREELLYHAALSHQTAPFLKKVDSKVCPFVNVDVNMDIMWGESKKQTDMVKFLIYVEDAEVYGISVKKLKPIAEFIALCLHHYKDMNSIYLLAQGSLKLNLFCDIYFYLIVNNLDIVELKLMCQAFNVIEYVHYCINAANEIFNDERLLPYLVELKSDKDKVLANSFGLDDSERKEWNVDLYSRMFSKNFNLNFLKLLTKNDLEKIEINKKYML